MKQILALDFADNYFSLRKFTWLGLVFFGVGLSLAVLNYQTYQAQHAKFRVVEQQLASLQPVKKTVRNVESQANDAISAQELKQMQGAVNLLITPWQTLFIGLEKVDAKDVALLTVEPSVKKGQLVMTGQAKHMQAALNYVKQLEGLPMLRQVYLQKHEVDENDPFKPVSFTIVAVWHDADI